jgi:hypothetical protein
MMKTRTENSKEITEIILRSQPASIKPFIELYPPFNIRLGDLASIYKSLKSPFQIKFHAGRGDEIGNAHLILYIDVSESL